MTKEKFIYWQEENFWLGYLIDYPDYRTQGQTFEELQENLKDIYLDIINGKLENVRKVGELTIV
jgi:predicted RNase H-like HicB family nuclease